MVTSTKVQLLIMSLILLNPFVIIKAQDDDVKKDKIPIEDASEDKAEPTLKGDNQIRDLQTKYSLTDEQIKTLKESGFKPNEIVRIAELSQFSSKPISEIINMRNEKKMGWGKIAKELGMHPGDLGRAVSSMNRHNRVESSFEKADKMNRKMEKNLHRHENSHGKNH